MGRLLIEIGELSSELHFSDAKAARVFADVFALFYGNPVNEVVDEETGEVAATVPRYSQQEKLDMITRLIADMLLDKHRQYQRREYERQMREELAAAVVQSLEEEDETT